jgi:hypothetical protein
VYTLRKYLTAHVGGANPNCLRCGGNGVIGRFRASPALNEDPFADELRAIAARPSARTRHRKVDVPGPSGLAARPYQPEFKGHQNLSACPHCACMVRPNRLEKHLSERCPKLHVLKESAIAPKPQAITGVRANPKSSVSPTSVLAVPWVCPECFEIICAADASQSVALELWRQHANGMHLTGGGKDSPRRRSRKKSSSAWAFQGGLPSPGRKR